MVLTPLTGASTGTNVVAVPMAKLGSILISADGTNGVTVTISNVNDGKILFTVTTYFSAYLLIPIHCEYSVTLAVSGSNGSAMLYGWTD